MLKIKSVIILFFFIISTTFANSNDKVSFIDIDFILKNSNLGKSILNEIENLNNKNIDELQNKEKELKKIEEEIKSKKIFYQSKNLKKK